MAESRSNLIWMDLEMTGLNPEVNVIIEIATVVTDADLEVLAEGPSLVIHQPEHFLEAMDPWNTEQHGRTGLTRAVRDSDVTVEEAERRTLDFVRAFTAPREAPLCGNSIGQDRRFLVRYMPFLHDHLHYRNVDVSTLKELARRWCPDRLEGLCKSGGHRALDDVRESIEELRFYRRALFGL